MSITLYPAIQYLDPDSLCYSIYAQLYNNFFNAQDKKDSEHPWGVVEGDDTSIRLRNTAYNFADAISGAIDGQGETNQGGILIDYLKKSGGLMWGLLSANYGFEAGLDNHRLMETYHEQLTDEAGTFEKYGIRFTHDIEIGANNLFIGGRQLLEYEQKDDKTIIRSSVVNFESTSVLCSGNILVGADINNGVYISSSILINGNQVYHGGNSNNITTDWLMYNGRVEGSLLVKGDVDILNKLRACYGAELGYNGKAYMYINNNIIHVDSDISFSIGSGIRINDIPVLTRIDQQDIQVGAIGGSLHIGNGFTDKVILRTGIWESNAQYTLLTKYGAAYFPDSLTVRHNFGKELLSSYRIDNQDEGIIIHERLRLGSSTGAYLSAQSRGMALTSRLTRYNTPNAASDFEHTTSIFHDSSTSFYQPLDRLSNSSVMNTDADFFKFSKPLEALGHIGIDNSYTRLAKEGLFFTSENFLLSVTDGIKHYGNSYFLNNLSCERFSSGFAGSGWAIQHNQTTGNIQATFDELTIRKKMRVYELEVQKDNITNGALWISNNCPADIVEKL